MPGQARMPLSETRMQQLLQKSVECAPYNDSDHLTFCRRTPPMRTYLAGLLAAVALPLTAYAQEATVKEVHDTPAVRGSIIANLLQEHDNPFTLYPYDTNYVLYTWTSDLNKEAIRSYDWAENARKDEVKYQLSLAFPFWRGILGPNSVLGASYTQKSWWQLSNSGESSPFRDNINESHMFSGISNVYRYSVCT